MTPHDLALGRRWRWTRGVRARFVLILLFGIVLPNALLAVWLGISARASALSLLEAQLQERLADAARTIGQSWIQIRSPLLTLAEDPRVQAALRGAPHAEVPAVVNVGKEPLGLQAVSGSIDVRDLQGRLRAQLIRALDESAIASQAATYLPVRVPLFDAGGDRVGFIETRIALASVLPPVYGWAAAAGSVPVTLTGDGTPLVQTSLEPLLGDQRRFEWGGQQWVAAYRAIREPELRLALAAPTAPATAPFTAAARRGLVGLAMVFGLSVAFTLLLSRGVSASVGSLAGAAEAVADGHLDRDPVRESGPDEVQRLARAFNRMTASLRLLVRRVAQQESAAAVGEFAASLAHEIRNPLTSVRLDLERTRERLIPASEVDELVARVLSQVGRLDATVSGALRIARSGSLELGPTDLREPVAAALRTASPMLAERGVRLSAWAAPDEPLRVQANAAGVEQMLLNLLMNAADAVVARDDVDGGERVWVETMASPGVVEIRVVDKGRGMNPQERERALEAFYTTRPEGTGLGLTVVKRIADAHGAELTIESGPGLGTRVTITFHQNGNGRLR